MKPFWELVSSPGKNIYTLEIIKHYSRAFHYGKPLISNCSTEQVEASGPIFLPHSWCPLPCGENYRDMAVSVVLHRRGGMNLRETWYWKLRHSWSVFSSFLVEEFFLTYLRSSSWGAERRNTEKQPILPWLGGCVSLILGLDPAKVIRNLVSSSFLIIYVSKKGNIFCSLKGLISQIV